MLLAQLNNVHKVVHKSLNQQTKAITLNIVIQASIRSLYQNSMED